MARQSRQLRCEILKAQVHVEGVSIFLEQMAGQKHVRSTIGLGNGQHARAVAHRSRLAMVRPSNADRILLTPSTNLGPGREV